MKHLRFVVAGSLIALTLSATSQADKAPDPVLGPYRAYKVAIAKGDLVGAEVAAKNALSASETKGGVEGPTAVLALNLAILEVGMNKKADAIAPAKEAVELANAGSKGVVALQARLLLGEAMLSVHPEADQHETILALTDADNRPDLDPYAYPAAVALANAAQQTKRWTVMLSAWRSAEHHHAGAGTEPKLMLGRALVGEGISEINLHDDRAAGETAGRALDVLADLAPEATDDQISLGEQTFAQAKAVQAVASARLVSEGKRAEVEIEHPRKNPPGDHPQCSGVLIPDPMPEFPPDQEWDKNVGAVVLRAKRNSQGEILQTRVLAAFPGGSFAESVSDPKIKWRFVPAKDAVHNCRVETDDLLITVRFVHPLGRG